MNTQTNREALPLVRPAFVLAGVAFLIVLLLPSLIASWPVLQRGTLALAAVAVGSGWVLLVKDRSEPKSRWRAWISLATAAYLTASMPTVFFELSQWKWLRHPAASIYVRPWVSLGLLPHAPRCPRLLLCTRPSEGCARHRERRSPEPPRFDGHLGFLRPGRSLRWWPALRTSKGRTPPIIFAPRRRK